MGDNKVATLVVDKNKNARLTDSISVEKRTCHVLCYVGLHGVATEPQSCCSLVLLAASLHHSLSANKEAASAGFTVPPVDQTCNSKH